jgi:hypothetical protein
MGEQTTIDAQRVFLERLEVGVQVALSDIEWANTVDAEALRDSMSRHTFLAFSSFLAAGAPQDTSVSVSVPSSWWQHWKRDALPRWVSKHLTIKTKTEVRKKRTYAKVCPHIGIPEQKKHVEFFIYDQ